MRKIFKIASGVKQGKPCQPALQRSIAQGNPVSWYRYKYTTHVHLCYRSGCQEYDDSCRNVSEYGEQGCQMDLKVNEQKITYMKTSAS